jgi:hypothetical protein
MLMTGDDQPGGRLQRIIDKNAARQMVAAMLAGSGLVIKPLASELVVTNPEDPERGELCIEYATGYVSLRRVIWEHWGPLDGYWADEACNEKYVGIDQILAALGKSGDAKRVGVGANTGKVVADPARAATAALPTHACGGAGRLHDEPVTG